MSERTERDRVQRAMDVIRDYCSSRDCEDDECAFCCDGCCALQGELPYNWIDIDLEVL